jgi:hypothetical protein
MTLSDTADEPSTPSGRWRIVALAIVVLVAVVAAVVLLVGGDDDDDDSATTTEATIETTTPTDTTPATEPPETTPATEPPATPAPTEPPVTEPPPGEGTALAVWPAAGTAEGFADPVEAATSFATEFLGFSDPVVGEFMAGDSRSGEIELRAGEVGPVTLVLLRQLGDDDSWWVLGSEAENIEVETPEAGAVIQSPLVLEGSALAFEGTVDVELRADGLVEPIATGFVTGSGPPEAGPFEGSIEFDDPAVEAGVLVLISRSSEDGSVLEASTRRVFFG